MEEEKAAAYYEELTRKGEGAARFKHGLGFSSSSFLNPSSNPKSTDIRSIRDKLKKSEDRITENQADDRPRYRSRERDRRRSRSLERRGDRERRRSRRRSSSPRHRRRSDDERRGRRREQVKEKKMDYSRFIKGYHHMSAAEKVKAKMKLQLDETAAKDTSKGVGWERFEFDKDAPLDDEEVEEGTDDDAALVKRIGQSFRFSAIEDKREEQLKAAHDEAMFGVPTRQIPTGSNHIDVAKTTNANDDERENNRGATNLLSEKVLAKQQGSWRDRAHKS